MGRQRGSKTAIERQQRIAQALELRAANVPYRQIAEKLGISTSNAHSLVMDGLDQIIREPAEQLRDMELDRCDRIMVGLISKGLFKGDTRAVTAAVKIMDHRAKLTGLYNVQDNSSAEQAGKALAELITAITSSAPHDDDPGDTPL